MEKNIFDKERVHNGCISIGLDNFYGDVYSHLNMFFFLFDKLYINHDSLDKYEFTLSHFPDGRERFSKNMNILQVLKKLNLVEFVDTERIKIPEELKNNNIYTGFAKALINSYEQINNDFIQKQNKGDLVGAFSEYLNQDKIVGDYTTRLNSIIYSYLYPEFEYTPLINSLKTSGRGNFITTKADVINILFKQMPVIREEIPIEKIIEFRENPKNRRRYFELRDLITSITQESLSPVEIRDKIEYLLLEYKNGLKNARIDFYLSTIKTVALIPLEIVKNISNLSGIFNPLVDLVDVFKARQTLLKVETELPGRGLSYFHAIQKNFRPKKHD